MFLDVLESVHRPTVVIMPGGFHPFHAGHMALYNSIEKKFPKALVFVAATDDQNERPFPFATKQKLAALAGVPKDRFVQVKSPFRSIEITSKFDPENTNLIFVRSKKDENEPPHAGTILKSGKPSYLQKYQDEKKLEPMSKHAYIAYLPTVEFADGITSASEIRAKWPTLEDIDKDILVNQLYPKATYAQIKNVVKTFDQIIGANIFESSGYIPTDSEKNDPRWQMALSQDVRPGAVERNLEAIFLTDKIDELLAETIKKIGPKKWRLYSKKGDKNLGTFNSLKAAKKHEGEVQYFKHLSESLHREMNREEELLPVPVEMDFHDMLKVFLPLAIKELDLPGLPKIAIEKTLPNNGTQASFGGYNPNTKGITLAIANRHPVDILRTLAHELVHFKQDLNDELHDASGETGSDHENEANARAGVIMRRFNNSGTNTSNARPLSFDNDLDETITQTGGRLYFHGSPCTKDCSGHMAGYEWSAQRNGSIANGHSTSFNNGTRIRAAGK